MPEKVAFVTGASQGIGLAVARGLLGRGWKVAICARRAEGVARATAELTGGLPIVANRFYAAGPMSPVKRTSHAGSRTRPPGWVRPISWSTTRASASSVRSAS